MGKIFLSFKTSSPKDIYSLRIIINLYISFLKRGCMVKAQFLIISVVKSPSLRKSLYTKYLVDS